MWLTTKERKNTARHTDIHTYTHTHTHTHTYAAKRVNVSLIHSKIEKEPRWDTLGAERSKKKSPETRLFQGFSLMSHSGLEPETT